MGAFPAGPARHAPTLSFSIRVAPPSDWTGDATQLERSIARILAHECQRSNGGVEWRACPLHPNTFYTSTGESAALVCSLVQQAFARILHNFQHSQDARLRHLRVYGTIHKIAATTVRVPCAPALRAE